MQSSRQPRKNLRQHAADPPTTPRGPIPESERLKASSLKSIYRCQRLTCLGQPVIVLIETGYLPTVESLLYSASPSKFTSLFLHSPRPYASSLLLHLSCSPYLIRIISARSNTRSLLEYCSHQHIRLHLSSSISKYHLVLSYSYKLYNGDPLDIQQKRLSARRAT